MLEIVHALESAAFARCHITTLPGDYRHLAGRHRDERGSRRRALNSYTRCPKLDYILPDVPLTSLAVPFKLLKARYKRPNLGQPRIDDPFVVFIEFSIFLDEAYLPIRECINLTAGVRRECPLRLFRRKALERLSKASSPELCRYLTA